MMFLKAETLEGKTEYFNADKILTIMPEGNTTKILMGAGMFWKVKSDSLRWIHHELVIMEAQKKC